MITHSITLVKKESTDANDEWDEYAMFRNAWPTRHTPHTPRSFKRMDKITYAQYITRIPKKIGDFLVINSLDLNGPDAKNIWRWYVIKDIQELHNMVEYADDLDPKCMYLQALSAYSNGVPPTPFWSSPTFYKVVEPTSVPQEVKDAYANISNRSKAN